VEFLVNFAGNIFVNIPYIPTAAIPTTAIPTAVYGSATPAYSAVE
jgi:hypothetical protein